MNKSRELLIGLFACVMLAILYWGISFLKGENVFSNKRYFYAVYENVDGLTISRPVTVNGFRVGQVSNINFSKNKKSNLIVEVAIEEDILFSRQSILEIYDSDIMGSKSLELKVNYGDDFAVAGDTLLSSIATGLTSEVTEQFGSVKVGLDQLIRSFDNVLKEVKSLSVTMNRILLENEVKFSNSIYHIESISSAVDNQTESINNTISNLSSFTEELSTLDIIQLSDKIHNITNQIQLLMLSIHQGEGSVSKLFTQDSIHDKLLDTIDNLNQLMIDIQNNPKKYINISVFGNDKKTKK